MGVKFLESFAIHRVSNGTKWVSIVDEIVNYRETHGQDPLIVVDLTPFFQWGFSSDIQGFQCGGRSNVFEEKCRKFFSNLKALNARIVCFASGPPLRITHYCKRIDERMDRQNEAIAKIENGPIEDLPDLFLTSFDRHLYQIAREFGEVRYSVEKAHNSLIAHFAVEHKAMAVMAKDSDFLVFSGTFKYWNVHEIQVEEMKVIEFSREALRLHLEIEEDQMPLFASLGGNTIIPRDEVGTFIYTMKDQSVRHPTNFKGIVQYLNGLPGRGSSNGDNNDVLIRISMDVKRRRDEEFIQKLKMSIEFYQVKDSRATVQGDLERKLLKMDDCFLFWLLKEIPTDHYPAYFDMQGGSFPSFSKLTAHLLARIMGVVLQDKCQGKYKPQRYICKGLHFQPTQLMTLYPIEPKFNLPPLQDLIFAEGDKKLEATRFQLLAWIVSPNLSGEPLQKIKGDFLSAALTTFLLVEKRFITKEEADAFLVTLNQMIKGTIPIQQKPPPKMNMRHFTVSFLIPVIQKLVNQALDVCGLGKYVKVGHDGVHFHNLLQEWNGQPEDGKKDLLIDIAEYRLYE